MSKVNQIFLTKWFSQVVKMYKSRKQRKQTAYSEKQWDMKLRGLK